MKTARHIHIIRYGNHASDATLARQAELMFVAIFISSSRDSRSQSLNRLPSGYCITPIFRVEEIFAIFANFDFARNFPPAKIISTASGISRNFPPAKFSSPRNFPPRDFFSNSGLSLCNKNGAFVHIANSSLIVGITGFRIVVYPD